MSIKLENLTASGPGKPIAVINFRDHATLIRGPSDTGKSYIRDCLWYLLGGDKIPKQIPEAVGYDTLQLDFRSHDHHYSVRRALSGGGSSIIRRAEIKTPEVDEILEIDEGQLLVALSGAEGRQILRSKSDKGAVTSGDLRHWFLVSQPAMISEDPTSGIAHDKTQRVASFNLFLTGNDDTAIELRKSAAEVERIKGQLSSAEEALRRIQAGMPPRLSRNDVEDSFDRVNTTLTALNSQYEARAEALRKVRVEIADETEELAKVRTRLGNSDAMVQRFTLLDAKYSSDLDRLGATSEGISTFAEMPMISCPLCHTPIDLQADGETINGVSPRRYRTAIAAEIEKIALLRTGLRHALEVETARRSSLSVESHKLQTRLDELEREEAKRLRAPRVEFSASPKVLAERHSELSAQLTLFDEYERLSGEIARLKRSKINKNTPVSRNTSSDGNAVANLSRKLLTTWGFKDIDSVMIDSLECDLKLNGRTRLSYGAGRKALYLTAMTIAMLEHGMGSAYPHLGIVVLDSPLKAYADPEQGEAGDVPAATVTERFYEWLCDWKGPGQIVILENELIRPDLADRLAAIEFFGPNGPGRTGFYPSGA